MYVYIFLNRQDIQHTRIYVYAYIYVYIHIHVYTYMYGYLLTHVYVSQAIGQHMWLQAHAVGQHAYL